MFIYSLMRDKTGFHAFLVCYRASWLQLDVIILCKNMWSTGNFLLGSFDSSHPLDVIDYYKSSINVIQSCKILAIYILSNSKICHRWNFIFCTLLRFSLFSLFHVVFEQVTKNAVRGLWARRSRINLVGAHVDVFSGEWTQKVNFSMQ